MERQARRQVGSSLGGKALVETEATSEDQEEEEEEEEDDDDDEVLRQ